MQVPWVPGHVVYATLRRKKGLRWALFLELHFAHDPNFAFPLSGPSRPCPGMEPHRHRASCLAALALQWLLATTPTMSSVVCAFPHSSFWYGKGKTFCAAHRTAWQKSKAQAEDAEVPSYVSEADDEVLGARYCEPSMMMAPERFNEVKKTALHLCVQGTFIPERRL